MANIADHAWDGLPTDSHVVLNGGLNIALGGGGTSQIQGRRDSSVGSIRRDEPDWDIKTDGEKYLDSLERRLSKIKNTDSLRHLPPSSSTSILISSFESPQPFSGSPLVDSGYSESSPLASPPIGSRQANGESTISDMVTDNAGGGGEVGELYLDDGVEEGRRLLEGFQQEASNLSDRRRKKGKRKASFSEGPDGGRERKPQQIPIVEASPFAGRSNLSATDIPPSKSNPSGNQGFADNFTTPIQSPKHRMPQPIMTTPSSSDQQLITTSGQRIRFSSQVRISGGIKRGQAQPGIRHAKSQPSLRYESSVNHQNQPASRKNQSANGTPVHDPHPSSPSPDVPGDAGGGTPPSKPRSEPHSPSLSGRVIESTGAVYSDGTPVHIPRSAHAIPEFSIPEEPLDNPAATTLGSPSTKSHGHSADVFSSSPRSPSNLPPAAFLSHTRKFSASSMHSPSPLSSLAPSRSSSPASSIYAPLRTNSDRCPKPYLPPSVTGIAYGELGNGVRERYGAEDGSAMGNGKKAGAGVGGNHGGGGGWGLARIFNFFHAWDKFVDEEEEAEERVLRRPLAHQVKGGSNVIANVRGGSYSNKRMQREALGIGVLVVRGGGNDGGNGGHDHPHPHQHRDRGGKRRSNFASRGNGRNYPPERCYHDLLREQELRREKRREKRRMLMSRMGDDDDDRDGDDSDGSDGDGEAISELEDGTEVDGSEAYEADGEQSEDEPEERGCLGALKGMLKSLWYGEDRRHQSETDLERGTSGEDESRNVLSTPSPSSYGTIERARLAEREGDRPFIKTESDVLFGPAPARWVKLRWWDWKMRNTFRAIRRFARRNTGSEDRSSLI